MKPKYYIPKPPSKFVDTDVLCVKLIENTHYYLYRNGDRSGGFRCIEGGFIDTDFIEIQEEEVVLL